MAEAVADSLQINQTAVRLIKDDITDIEVDAFVFYAESNLAVGTGVGTAISVRGGPTIQKELDELGPVAVGEAVVSQAGKLKAQHIIHAVGPKFQEEDIEGKLRTTVLSALKAADGKGIQRVAFPAMGAGYYGILPDVSARIMLEVIAEYLKGETGIKELTLCVLDTTQYAAFQARLKATS